MAFQAVWVEIPVKDINRAAKFYGTLFDKELKIYEDDIRRTTIITEIEEFGIGASLTETAGFEPCDKGVFLYIQAGEDLNTTLTRIEPAGGKIITGKTSMGEAGFYAAFADTEGNVLGLHSMK